MYTLEQAMRAIRHNWVASVATMTTMTLSLTILAAFSLLSLNLSAFLKTLQDELEIAVYLDSNADVPSLMQAVSAWPEVTGREFIPPEQALDEMLELYPFMGQAASLIENPLPPTIRLKAANITQVSELESRLYQLDGVEEVDSGEEDRQTFIAVNEVVRIGGSALIVILLGSSLFAIINSIRAAITARKNEIEVMRLVGATRTFIRAPFLIEGFLLGFFSALMTIAISIPSYFFILNRLVERFRFIPFVRDNILIGQVLLLILALAVLVGLIGSSIAVAQYLQEQD